MKKLLELLLVFFVVGCAQAKRVPLAPSAYEAALAALTSGQYSSGCESQAGFFSSASADGERAVLEFNSLGSYTYTVGYSDADMCSTPALVIRVYGNFTVSPDGLSVQLIPLILGLKSDSQFFIDLLNNAAIGGSTTWELGVFKVLNPADINMQDDMSPSEHSLADLNQVDGLNK